MNNKAQTESGIVSILSGIVLLCALGIGATAWIGASADTYSISFDETQYSFLNKTGEITNLTQELNTEFLAANNTGSTNVLDIINVATTAGFTSVKIIGKSSGIYYAIIVDGASILYIDYVYVLLAVLIIIVVLVSIFILLVMKVR